MAAAPSIAWRRLDAQHSALHLHAWAGEPARRGRRCARSRARLRGVRETIRLFWDSPFPATLQDSHFRLRRRQPGVPRLQRLRARAADRPRPARAAARGGPARRHRDAARAAAQLRPHRRAGAVRRPPRRCRRPRALDPASRAACWSTPTARPLYLALMQDTTAEHVARERADRSVRELDDWFDLSPVGMVLFDDSGLLRAHQPGLRRAGRHGAGDAEGRTGRSAGAARLGCRGVVCARARRRADGAPGLGHAARRAARLLRAIVRCYQTAGGQRRYMAVVEDRSVEEERDLAQMQIGALMDTAGVGLATFQESSGWVRQRQQGSRRPARLRRRRRRRCRAISRDIVAPESLPEFERLQAALRHAAARRGALRDPARRARPALAAHARRAGDARLGQAHDLGRHARHHRAAPAASSAASSCCAR